MICRDLALCFPKTLEEKSFCSSKSSRALQAFGLLPLPCFTNSFLLAARVLRVNVNSLSARKIMGEPFSVRYLCKLLLRDESVSGS